ncbi:hypothetical protein [Sapientia aquatica]|uniref:Uncharacterized protein n=1 Tax=Sapientia aquatica TaxID=1549640 RepID=A0A4R5W6F2_9BURK|nr:hypothetical protein [Sapientia aquatica]TDK68530.1 hypothetical protein E2I14_03035 [Sapientia aquatica]
MLQFSIRYSTNVIFAMQRKQRTKRPCSVEIATQLPKPAQPGNDNSLTPYSAFAAWQRNAHKHQKFVHNDLHELLRIACQMPDYSKSLKRLAKLKEIDQKPVASQAVPNHAVKVSRHARLTLLLSRIDAGNDVARRELKNALTADEWGQFDEFGSYIRSGHLGERPEELKKYVELLRKADFFHSRADSTPVNSSSKRDANNRTGRDRLRFKAEATYEKALEYLSEILDSTANRNGLIEMWLDRPVDMTPGHEPSLDPISMPRLKGSTSVYCQSQAELTIFDQLRDAKRSALVNAIESLVQS